MIYGSGEDEVEVFLEYIAPRRRLVIFGAGHDAQPLVRLQDLLAANQTLMTVYLMKAELKTLWTAATAWGWRMTWKQWLRHAHESEIPALIQFAKRLKRYWRGIVSRVRWPMHTGQLEGINNRIKVIKRMAYGYRDSEFFFMKIKSVFPGNP
ncbi:transposase [Pseudomonas sp. GL-RE-26]|uniref:transposase n=1 Tax=Pseudomonas sp. GL-RE-26 TaxID=2832390 RepID=UPI001CBB7EA0|nr:transposase [Pseudomonas sp. GL-RE-26]